MIDTGQNDVRQLFVKQGKKEEVLKYLNLDEKSITKKIQKIIKK